MISARANIAILTGLMVLLTIFILSPLAHMNALVLIFFAVLITIFIIAPLAELSFLVYRIRRRFLGWLEVLIFCLFLVNCLLSYGVYSMIYPPDSFYENEFRNVTGLDFPPSGAVVFGDRSFPDLHGDYGSVCVIDVDRGEFDRLRQLCGNDTSASFCGSTEWDAFEEYLGHKPKYSAVHMNREGDMFTLWGILEDPQAVVVYRISS
jgi:hypothetical protein